MLTFLRQIRNDLHQHNYLAFQAGGNFVVRIFVLLLGFAIKSIQTRELGPEEFGLFAFFVSLTNFTVVFISFGFLSSLSVLLAGNSNPQREKSLIGLSIILTTGLGILYACLLFALSFFIDGWYQIEFGHYLRLLAPLCLLLPFQNLIHQISIGKGQILLSSVYSFVQRAIYIGVLLLLIFFDEISLFWVLVFNLLTYLAALLPIVIVLKPNFSRLKWYWNILYLKNRKYGQYIYYSVILSAFTHGLVEILIPLFVNTTELGFYSLAAMLCFPMLLMSQSVSYALFKTFANSLKIPRKVFVYNLLWLLSCVAILAIFARPVILLIFGQDFEQAIAYVLPFSIVIFFQGMYQPYHFLGAKAMGKEVRNVSILEITVSLLLIVPLLKMYGVYGAITAAAMAKFAHLIGKTYYYRRYLKSLENQRK